MQEYLGWIALVVTLLFTACGMPAQILKNYRAKSANGLSLLMCILWLMTFVSWIAYAQSKSDMFIMIANVVGAFFVTIMIGQVFWYRKGVDDAEKASRNL